MTKPKERIPERDTARYHEQIIDSLACGVIAFDGEGTIVVVNQAAREHLETSEAELRCGMNVEGLPLDNPFVDVLRRVLADHTPLDREEVHLVKADGGHKIIGLSASLLKGPKPFNGAVFLCLDITERRALEQALELNVLLAQIGQLTSGVVHELRNPLSVIGGMTELLQRRVESDDPRRKSVDAILREVGQLERLLTQFLGFARPFALDPMPCRIEDIIEETLTFCHQRAQRKNIPVTVTHEAETADEVTGAYSLYADASRLAQALVNIMNYLIDATPGGGQVALRTHAEADHVHFDLSSNAAGLHVKAGQDFSGQLSSIREAGPGLRLAIADRIISGHGGTVDCRPVEGGGACFLIQIPKRRGGGRQAGAE